MGREINSTTGTEDRLDMVEVQGAFHQDHGPDNEDEITNSEKVEDAAKPSVGSSASCCLMELLPQYGPTLSGRDPSHTVIGCSCAIFSASRG